MEKGNVKCFRNPLMFSCNVYVLCGEQGTILVDPGFYDRNLREYLAECGGLDAVLVTHSHWDHIFGLTRLREDYPDVPVYHHVLDEGFAGNSHLNGSEAKGFSFVCEVPMRALTEGIQMLGGYLVRVIHTPGHTMGSCAYVFPEEGCAFVGDSILFADETVTTNPTGCPVCQASTVEKFRWLPIPGDGAVYCGHHENGSYAQLMENHPQLNPGHVLCG